MTKRSSTLLLILAGYILVGIVLQIVFPDSQTHPFSNLASMAGDLPQNIGGFLFGILYVLLTVVFWPMHLIAILFS